MLSNMQAFLLVVNEWVGLILMSFNLYFLVVVIHLLFLLVTTSLNV